MPYCVFCNIIAGTEPADVLYQDDELMVFRNRLRWVPVMLLATPKRHLMQEELWSNLGAVGRVAFEMGQRHCPHGFRLVSNFGWDALQSQPHAHIHILGGGPMEAVTPLLRSWRSHTELDYMGVSQAAAGEWPPVVMIAEPRAETDQAVLWANMGEVGAELVRLGMRSCPGGFRLVSNVGWDALQDRAGAHVYLLGGDELGHYV
ncbi:MAG: HIT domain-containing protein [Dehalococcoidia bacterium]